MSIINLDSIVLKFNKELTKLLEEENNDNSRIELYKDAVEKAKEFCKYQFDNEFGKHGGQFTSHGPDHAARVLEFVLTIANRLKPKINATELFSLGISTILHDTGMTEPLPKDVIENIKNEDQRWDERRKRHGDTSAELIRRNEYTELKIISKVDEDTYFKYIPHICAAHCTKGFKENINEIRKIKRQSKNINRYELIAGILLLADELDLSFYRARPDVNKYNEFKTTLTKAHWWKHWLIENVEIAGNIIYISCIHDNVIPYSDQFILWTKSKIEAQLEMLKQNLDINDDNHLWNFEIIILEVEKPWWALILPELTIDIVEEAQRNRLEIKGQKMYKVLNPEKLIEGIPNKHAIKPPSTFFRNVIARRINHFRGQGQYIDLKTARLLYVEEARNMSLINHTINEWLDYVEYKNSGVKLKMFVGDIGVGKTHFLSTFLFEIKEKKSKLFTKTVIARSEFTECERNNLLSLQKHVAIALYKDLNIRLKILEKIRSIMLTEFTTGIDPAIPKHIEEIESWGIDQINSFIKVVGTICTPESNINQQLGQEAPIALCIFCDNSDQMKNEVINDLYQWSYNISGTANCLVWTFLRPDTLAYLEGSVQKSPFSLRGAEPIYAPTLEEVINRRLETFPNRFTKNEKIEISSGYISPSDCHKSLSYIISLTLETSDSILQKLTERLDKDGQPNLRAGLQALISILGSHVISDKEYARAFLLERAKDEENKDSKRYKPIFERWPKIIEALILGRRIWYSPLSGAIENLFDPPQIESYGDYFIMIHALQLLQKNKTKDYKFYNLVVTLKKIGYSRGRIQEILKYLASRANIDNDDTPYDDPFIKRTFPLIEVHINSLDHPFKDNTLIQITPWGEFHLSVLLYQAQYWKHIYYNITFPSSLCENLSIEGVTGYASDLRNELNLVFNYLTIIEDSWLCNFSESELNSFGIFYIVEQAKDKIFKQLGDNK